MITCDNWTDDAAATRLLRVLEERMFDYGCAVEALQGLASEYLDASLNEDGRAACSKRLDLQYDAVCSQLRLILNELMEFDRDLTAAIEGTDSRIVFARKYLNEITTPQK